MKRTTQQSAHITSAPNGPAYVFTGAIDGEWTNLKNWEDANGNSPASSLPTTESDVVITGLVDTIPNGITAEAYILTINSEAEIRIPINVSGHATVRGIVGIGEKGCGISNYIFNGTGGIILPTVLEEEYDVTTHKVEFFDNGINRGNVEGPVIFNDSSYNTSNIYDRATFNDNSHNQGTIHGDAIFNDESYNFYDLQDGEVGDGFGIVSGDATWSGSAFTNFSTGTVNGTITFSSAVFTPVVFTTTANFSWDYNTIVPARWIFNTPGPTWIFNGSSSNNSSLAGNATFNNSSSNSHWIEGSAIFNNSSNNAGEISGNATFNDESYNAALNGEVHDNATFNDSSYNNGTVHDNATFNDSSYNSGIVSDDATFNESSYNSGEVRRNAAFNNSSYNTCSLGSVTGTVTYNGLTGDVPPNSYVLGQCVT